MADVGYDSWDYGEQPRGYTGHLGASYNDSAGGYT